MASAYDDLARSDQTSGPRIGSIVTVSGVVLNPELDHSEQADGTRHLT
ncbi:MAG: hypothetical protein IT194_09365 [Microthrixaceae bacterium]|nr:hypothetical protein [Microthrixaceae bacterium]